MHWDSLQARKQLRNDKQLAQDPRTGMVEVDFGPPTSLPEASHLYLL